jgi:hypothetical protein
MFRVKHTYCNLQLNSDHCKKKETEQLDGKPKLITEVVMHINASMED